MSIKLKIAKTKNDHEVAKKLVRESYQKSFALDINHLRKFHKETFQKKVIMAYSTNEEELLGTMSIQFPNRDGKYPSESLFKYNLSSLNLANQNYVEIGQFATSENGKSNPLIVISLFLGAIAYLKESDIPGWIATVKNDVFGFLQNLSLEMTIIDQFPTINKEDPLINYVDDLTKIHLMKATIENTEASFRRFNRFITSEKIRIQSS